MPNNLEHKTTPKFLRASLIDCTALALLCAIMYLPAITSLGLVNWQEGQRALVAREMLRADEWIVPTRGGEVYLAKPPMIYWCQMGLARARGATEVEPIDLRLTVALAGMLGVICTYFLARFVTNGDQKRPIALISALGLAVGVLYVRSARVGELDILLVPCAVGAIGAVYYAWSCAQSSVSRWVCIALAALCCALAALTKGPPAIAVIALVAFGAPAWHAARAPGSRTSLVVSAIGALTFVAFSAPQADSVTDWLSVLLHASIGAGVGAVCAAMVFGGVSGWLKAVFRLHPEVVLGAGVLALVAWGWAVGARIGEEAVQAAANAEAADNLRILVVDSPLKNLGFIAYGMLPIGIFGLMELWRINTRRAQSDRGLVLCVVWVCAGFVLMSVAGKGVARYLTPIWPALAILGGIYLSRAADTPRKRALLGICALAMALSMTAWYGFVRPARVGDTSPRALIAELLAHGATNNNIATFGFDAPAAAFYAAGDIEWWALRDAELASDNIAVLAREYGSVYVLYRDERAQGLNKAGKANAQLVDLLSAHGLVIGDVETSARYARDRTGSEVGVWLVSE